jgi:hypothetical protein
LGLGLRQGEEPVRGEDLEVRGLEVGLEVRG